VTAVRMTWSRDLLLAAKWIRDHAERAEDMSDLFEEIAGIFGSATEDAFDNQADPAGNAWQALSEARVEQRTAKGSWPGKILQDDGILASSIQTSFGPTFAEVGSNMQYAAAQQFGRDEINLPARPFIGIGKEHEGDILAAIAAHFTIPAS
jgi:phage virion morphogenesis protein